MENPTPDPAPTTGGDVLGEAAIGQISPYPDGGQILNSDGNDIDVGPGPGLGRKVAWRSHPDFKTVITFDEEGVLTKDGMAIKFQIKILAKSKEKDNVYVLSKRGTDKSYYYDAKLVTRDGRRRRCLSGKRASDEEEKRSEDTYTATRPRIVVGTGGTFLPDDGDSPSDP